MPSRRLSAAARSRALDALAAHRAAHRRGFHPTLSESARGSHSSLRSMRLVAGRDAVRQVRGEWTYAPREDEAVRRVAVLERTPDGPRWVSVELRGLDQASKSGAHARAVQDGKWARVRGFEGRYVTDVHGHRHFFATDRAALQRLDREGGLRPEGLSFT
jgi:hypothetical protein